MSYVIAFQVLCGFFSSYVAGRKGRARLRWWLVGALVPVFGVMLSLLAPDAEAGSGPATVGGKEGRRRSRKRPKRCCGSYIPDCQGCSFFRRHLFDPDPSEDKKGYCRFYGKDLTEASGPRGPAVTIEDS